MPGASGARLSASRQSRQPHRAWADLFGSLIATVEGSPGGSPTLVLAPPELAADVTAVLLELAPFRGRVVLGVPERAHAAPVTAIVRALLPRAVVIVDASLAGGIAVAGPALPGEPGAHQASTGLGYVEPDELPAWDAGWLRERFPGARTADCALASAAGSGIAVVACAPAALAAALARVLGEN